MRNLIWPLSLLSALATVACSEGPGGPTVVAGFVLDRAPSVLASGSVSSDSLLPGQPSAEDSPAATDVLASPGPEPVASPPPVAATATPTAVPVNSGGGRGSGGGGTDTRVTGRVLDQADQPLAGAGVMLADGRSFTAGADGRFVITGGYQEGVVVVALEGYTTSAIAAGSAELARLHLRRADAATAPFYARTFTVSGRVAWPSADHSAGVAYYKDDLGSAANPVAVAPDGAFAITGETRRSGAPRGIVVVYAGDSLDRTLMGHSLPFAPLAAEQPGEVAVSVADRAVNYDGAARPALLTQTESRLEVEVPGFGQLPLQASSVASGTFVVPTGVSGSLRVVQRAESDDGQLASDLGVLVGAGSNPAVPFDDWLDTPSLSFETVSRRATWSRVSGAVGYRLEARTRGARSPAWEAWAGDATTFVVSAGPWLAAGFGELAIDAVDAAEMSTFALASFPARALRITPWEHKPSYRLARRRLAL